MPDRYKTGSECLFSKMFTQLLSKAQLKNTAKVLKKYASFVFITSIIAFTFVLKILVKYRFELEETH